MRKIIIILCLCIVCAAAGNADHFWLMCGGESASIFGEGVADNVYGWGWGCFFELGFSGMDGLGWNLGMSAFFLDNTVGESTILCTSIPVYFDVRYFFDLDKGSSYNKLSLAPFISTGSYLGILTYDTIIGNDLTIGITAGFGIYINFGMLYVSHILIRPCYILENDLGQSFGMEIQAGIGIGM